MKALSALVLLFCLLRIPTACGLTPEDRNALKELTKEYVSWDYSGRPVAFRNRLDYPSYEEQRRILIRLAESRWNGFWGGYWRRRGVADLDTLRSFAPRDFWIRYYSVLDPARDGHQQSAGRFQVDVHTIVEARGMAYVIYQAAPSTPDPRGEQDLSVLRARWADGEWRLVAFPRITQSLRAQLDHPVKRK